MTTKSTQTHHDIDNPLDDPNDDLLGRQPYAERVARMIEAWRGNHSAVIAIYGEWGSGKTTFKNFVLRQLAKHPNSPIVIEFNPWQWEGATQVAEAFFARIVEEIGGSGKKAAEVSERLSRYAAYFTIGASITKSASTILSPFLPVIGPLASLVASGLKDAGEDAKSGAAAKLKPQPLSTLRNDLIESIRKLDRTLVVTIDDVDRLTTAETAMLFQLLKSNADFPNMVYLILCDREVVSANLEKVVAGRGDDYLEKIVQLGLPLPKANPDQLRKSLLDGVLEIITDAGVEPLLDRDRLYNMYDHHAVAYFRTMRDVKRFLASFETVLPSVVRNGDSEVDLGDFVGAELLRTFEHDLYEKIYCYRARLLGQEGVLSEDDKFLVMLQGDESDDWPALGLFRELFPRFGPQKTLRKAALGIAHPRSFARYFAFAVPPDQYTAAQENQALTLRGTSGALGPMLEEARDSGRLQYLIELFEGATLPAGYADSVNYIAEIGAFMDSLHVGDSADNVLAYRSQLERLIIKCIAAFDVDTRTQLLLDACKVSGGIMLPLVFANFDKKNPHAVTDSGREGIREKALEMIVNADDRLRRHPALGEILIWWAENGDVDSAKRYAEAMLHDDVTLLNLLYAFSHPAVANIGKARKRRDGRRTFPRELNALVDVDKVLSRLNEIDEDHLTWDQRMVVRAFRSDVAQMIATDAENKVSQTTGAGNGDENPDE